MVLLKLIQSLFLALLAFGVCTPGESNAATFEGQVVDAETGEPLEGAVIAIMWHRSRLTPHMDGASSYFFSATETITDAQGKFVIDSSPGLVRLVSYHHHTVAVFKPGYHLSGGHFNNADQPIFEEPTIRLIKKNSLESRSADRWPEFRYIGFDVPKEKIKNLTRLQAIERKIMGLDRQ